MILNSPFISGSLTVTGNTILSGSITSLAGIAGTASYATNAEMLDGLDSTSFLNTSSFNTVSSSFSSRVTATEATASAFVTASGSLAARLVSNEAKTGSYATTGSNVFSGSQTISGSLTATGTITAQTLVVQTITSSVDFVTGSARFGTLSSNTHEFTGSVSISGSIITGTSADYVVLNNGNLYRTSGSGYGSVNITGRNVSLQYDNLSTGAITGLLVQSGSGNVGIGSLSPGNKLDVAGALSTRVTSSFNAYFTNTTTDALAAITIQSENSTSGVNSGSAAIELVGRADNTLHGRHAWIGAEGVIGQTYRTRVKFKIRGESNTGYTWANPNAEAPTIMTLDGNGYVGIGSSTPTVALDVVGNTKLTNNSSAVSITLNKNNSTAGASAQFYFQDQGTTKWDLGAFNMGAAGVNDFSLYNRSGSGSNPITVLYANNYVGIGTVSPSTELHVKAASSWAEIRIDGASGGGASLEYYSNGSQLGDIYYDTSGNMIVRTGGANSRMTVTSAGNVGLGTTSPNIGGRSGNATLTVKNTSTYGEIEIAGSSSTQGGVLSFYGDTTKYAELTGEYESSTNGMMIFRTRRAGSITEAMRITTTGVIDFNGNNTIASINDKFAIGINSTSYAWIQSFGGRALVLNASGNNVGIGTTNPSYRLTIDNVSGGNRATLGIDIFENYARIQAYGNGTSSGYLALNPLGNNVGIGITSPSEKLYVNVSDSANMDTTVSYGTNTKGIVINHEGLTGYGVGLWFRNSGLTAGIASTRVDSSNWATDLRFYTHPSSTTNQNILTERMRVTSEGNVGIGTTNPSKLLSVNGRMGTTAIVSNTIIAGNIASNIATSPSFILICDLNNAAGFSLAGKVNAASYTCWNISDIWIKKDYSSTTSAAGITGAYKSGCDFSIVDINYNAGRYIALRFTSNPEIDVMFTGYRLAELFAANGEATVVTGATVNSTLASY